MANAQNHFTRLRQNGKIKGYSMFYENEKRFSLNVTSYKGFSMGPQERPHLQFILKDKATLTSFPCNTWYREQYDFLANPASRHRKNHIFLAEFLLNPC